MKTVLKISIMICLVVMISKVVLTAAEKRKYDEAQKQIAAQSVPPKVHPHRIVHGAPATVSPIVSPYQHQAVAQPAAAEKPASTTSEAATAKMTQPQQPQQETYRAEREQHRAEWQRRESEEQAAYVTSAEQQEEQLETPSLESSMQTSDEAQETAPVSDGGAQENESGVSGEI